MSTTAQLHREWQAHWRTIMGKPDTDVLAHLDEDLFEYLFLPEDKFLACFSPIPNGEIIARRVMQAHAGVKENFDHLIDDELIALLQKTVLDLSSVLGAEVEDVGTPTVYRLSSGTKHVLNRPSDSLSTCFEDDFQRLLKRKLGEPGQAAYSFLSEPLYQIRQAYDPANWVMWGLLSDQYDLDPYETMFKLWYSGITFWMSNDGFHVLVRE